MMESGIFLLDKSEGLSSAAELHRLKKKLKLTKVGHAGTLDPMASGLLVCLTNSATRLASFAEKGKKRYSGRIKFGIVTDTDDIKGNITEEKSSVPDFKVIKNASEEFRGQIEQYPPSISAVKISGERAYKIARRGEVPEIKPRQVFIHKFEVSYNSDSEVNFIIECNSGTYVRSIARDLGRMLGCGACLSALRREASFPFHVKSASRIEEITQDHILKWTDLFPAMKHVELNQIDVDKVRRGNIRDLSLRLDNILKEQISPEHIFQKSEKIIYFGVGEERPLGILHNNEGRWEIAVNLQ